MIVSNATPLLHLARAGLLDLLPKLYTRVVVPASVRDEVIGRGDPRPEAQVLRAAVDAWLEVRSLTTRGRRVSQAPRHPTLPGGEAPDPQPPIPPRPDRKSP